MFMDRCHHTIKQFLVSVIFLLFANQIYLLEASTRPSWQAFFLRSTYCVLQELIQLNVSKHF